MLGLDDELTLYPKYSTSRTAHDLSAGQKSAAQLNAGWAIAHERIWCEQFGFHANLVGPRFARESDVLRAISALKSAGFTTARRLWFEREERNRIIGESMAW